MYLIPESVQHAFINPFSGGALVFALQEIHQKKKIRLDAYNLKEVQMIMTKKSTHKRVDCS